MLMRALQAVPEELSMQPPRPLSLQRIASLLTLLAHLTLAASSTAPEPSRWVIALSFRTGRSAPPERAGG